MALLTVPYGAQCDVSITNNYDTVGTLTRANLHGVSPADFKALFTTVEATTEFGGAGFVWKEMSSLLRTQFEMAMCGLKRDGLYDWIMSSNKPGMSNLIDIRRQQKGPSLIHPFVLGRQISVVNDDYWVISTGFAIGAYTPGTTGPITDSSSTVLSSPIVVGDTANGLAVKAGARVFRLIAAYSVPLSAQYFLPRHFLYHINLSGGGVAQDGQWQIIDSAIATDGTYVDVLVNIAGPDTTTVDQTPITGIVINGPNSVHDVESYCKNKINVNPEKYVPFFYGTRRWGRRISSEYRKVLAKLLQDNAWFAAFQDLPIAERNRQDQMRDQKEFVNQFFFGRAISSAQTLTGWWDPNTGLRRVSSVDGTALVPGTSGELISFEALPVGVKDQLKTCGQWVDLQNQPLNIQTFCETYLYNIVRNRRQDSRPTNEIDVYTDSLTAGDFMSAMFAYAKTVYGDIIRLNVESGNQFGFSYTRFKLPRRPWGVSVNILTHNYFDDLLNTFSLSAPNTPSRGRFLAVLDLGKGGSIYPAILGSNRKTWVTGEISKLAAVDATYSCVMENPTVETSMTSVTSTVVVECPLKSIWVENFSSIVMP